MSKKHSGKITWVGPEDSPFREWWQRTHDLEEEHDGGNQMKKTSRLNSMAALPDASYLALQMPQSAPLSSGMISLNSFSAERMPEPVGSWLKSPNDLFFAFPRLRDEIQFTAEASPENRAFQYYLVTEMSETVKNHLPVRYAPKVVLFHTQDELHQYLVEVLEQPLLTVLLTGRRGNWQLFDWNDVANGYDFACPGDWLMPPMFGDNIAFCKTEVTIMFDVSGEHAEGQGVELYWDGGMGYVPKSMTNLERPVQDELNKLAYYSMSGQRRLNFLEHREMGQIKITKQLVLDAAELSGREVSRTGKCTVKLQSLLDVAMRGVQ